MIFRVFTGVYNHHYSQFWNIFIISERKPIHFYDYKIAFFISMNIFGVAVFRIYLFPYFYFQPICIFE